MKGQEEHKSIESIYRDGLKDWKAAPSGDFWSGFEKKLRYRQFIRFNPARFNIYYLAVVTAVTAATAILLLGRSPKETTPSPGVDIVIDKLAVENNIAVRTNEKRENSAVVSELNSEVNLQDKMAPGQRTDKSDEIIVVNTTGEIARTKTIRDNLNESFIREDSAQITQSRKAALLPKPIARLSSDKPSGCAPLTISFANLSVNSDSCLWDFGDGGLTTEKDPVWVFDEPGQYVVSLIAFGAGGSKSLSKQNISVYQTPDARFELNAGDSYLPDEQVIFYNYSRRSISWEWDFGDGKTSNDFEPGHFYERPGSYNVRLKAFTEHGCVDSMVITNAFGDQGCQLLFPNAFCPNDGGPTGGYYSGTTDQNEEVFHPVWSGVTQYQLRIYSRQGILLFETTDIMVGWDGYYKGRKAEPGVYIWKARGTFKNGQPFVKGGDVTLIPKW